MKPTFTNTIPKIPKDALSCGCIIGYFECPELQRIHAFRNDAYYRSDWKEYEKYRKMSWTHIGMEDGGVSIYD